MRFEGVKQKQRAMNICYMLLYQARIKVLHADRAHFVDFPEEVWDWLEVRGDEQIPALASHQAEGGPSGPRVHNRKGNVDGIGKGPPGHPSK
ncbi:hypothetical protein NDU88_004734 [Pleurodeles waltl]|uniref:Uncharacterized protein n=1 Tax=Pleurodeles waltl TaxID=8319 RepID=A0AAV7LJ85_PLEWA|nr:hypothetical protein NDU88_004734 [Pleurodeles waltl]